MVEEINKKIPNASLQGKCIALKEAMKISQEEADLVSKYTREQSEDPKWNTELEELLPQRHMM